MITDSEKIALITSDDKKISYNELLRSVTVFSEILLQVKPKDKILIWAENSEYWIYAFLSIWHQNAIPIPLDSNATPEILSYAINTCVPKYVFVSEKNAKTLKSLVRFLNHKFKIIVIDDYKNVAIHTKLPANIQFKNEDTALILFSSGVTGLPKPVMLSFTNILFCINAATESLFSDKDCLLAILPFHHILPLTSTLILPLHIGATIVFPPHLIMTDMIFETLQKHNVSVIVGVPNVFANIYDSMMSKIYANKFATFLYKLSQKFNNLSIARFLFRKIHKESGNSIRFFLSGGVKLDEKIYYGFYALGFEILEGYGMTETAPIITFSRLNDTIAGSVGKKLKGTQIKILDGEIVVRGPNVMQGYYNAPIETSKVLTNGWFFTGDIGTIDSKGYLRITGRISELIIMPNGKAVNPYEVESELKRYSDFVRDVGVFENDGELYAVIVIKYHRYNYLVGNEKIYYEMELKNMTKLDIIEEYNKTVSEYKHIKKFYITIEDLPRTKSGKLKRHKLHQLFKSTSYDKSTTHIEYEFDVVDSNKNLINRNLITSEYI